MFVIIYCGIEFIVWKIQSDKLFIMDKHDNKIGYIFITDDWKLAVAKEIVE